VILLQLALYFALLSCIAFGGLPAVVPEMQRIVVEVNGWATHDEFISWWVADLWERYKEAPARIALQRAIAPLVVALIFCGGYVVATPGSTPDWRLWLIAAASATAMLMSRLNPLWLLAAGGAIGAVLLGS